MDANRIIVLIRKRVSEVTKFSKIAAIALLVMGVILAVLAFFIAQQTPEPKTNKSLVVRPEVKPFTAVVAARDLPAGHLLRAEDVTTDTFAQMPAEGIAQLNLVVGRTAAVEIGKDQVVAHSSLLEGIAGLLAAGERAVSIQVDEASAVGHKLKPGDWVDVFVVLRRDGQELEATQARMLLPRKQIIAYGARIHGATQDDETKNKDGTSLTARTAVIAVQVQEVNRLLLAEQQGQVQLALRSPLDHHEPSPAMLQQIAGLTVPSGLPPGASSEVNALNASLLPFKTSDLGKEIGKATTPAISKTAVKPSSSQGRAKTSNGVSVEVIRGTRKESIRY